MTRQEILWAYFNNKTSVEKITKAKKYSGNRSKTTIKNICIYRMALLRNNNDIYKYQNKLKIKYEQYNSFRCRYGRECNGN